MRLRLWIVTVSVAMAAATLDVPQALAQEAPAVQPAPSTDGKAPKLRCDETTGTFEDVWSGDVVDTEFVIHNDGDATLEITDYKATCGCTKAEEFDRKIEPGKSVTMKFEVNTARMRGEITKLVQVWTNDTTAPQPLKLYIKGNVKPRIEIEPPNGARFGPTPPDEQNLTQTVTITNHTQTAMKLELQPTAAVSIFTHELKEIDAGKKYELTITANRPFNPRTNAASLQFRTGITEEPMLAVPCYLYALPLVDVQPTYVSIPAPVNVGGWQYNNVRVTYNGTAKDFKITSAEPSHEGVKAEVIEAEQGKTWRVALSADAGFDPPATPPMQVTLKTNLADQPEVFINLRSSKAPTNRVRAEALVGRPAPKVQVKGVDDSLITLGAQDSSVTVVDFWMSTCRWCRKQIPDVEQVAADYSEKGVKFLAVNVDSKQRPRENVLKIAQEELGMKTQVVFDETHAAVRAYGVSGYPTLFVIGKDGTIEAVHRGAKDTLAEELKEQLAMLLAGKTIASRGPAQPVPPAEPTRPSTPAEPTQPQNVTPALAFDEKQINIGDQKPDANVTTQVTYHNKGMQPLTIRSIIGSQGLTVNENFTRIVAPGKSGTAEVSFKTPSEMTLIEHTMSFDSNDPKNPKQSVMLSGVVKPWVEVQPMEGIDFGRRVPTFSMPRMASLISNGTDPVKYLSAESSSEKFSADIKMIGAGPNAIVTITAHPPFEPGENNAMITITTDCKQQPQATIPVQLFLPERIEITPETVEITRQPKLQKASVVIANNTADPTNSLHILGIEKSNRLIMTHFYPEALGYKLEMTFRPNFTCPPEGEKIVIRTDDPEYGEIVIPIKTVTSDKVSIAR